MKTKHLLIQALIALSGTVLCAEAPRQRTLLDDDWKFIQEDPVNAQAADLNDASWSKVTLPHDWSIAGKIDAKAPMGGGGGFFPAGIGWYRQHIEAPAAWKGKRVAVEFEGVYMNADVYLNGEKLASHPYGYTSFFVDLTAALKPGTTNILAVRVDNSQQKNSRWYSGSGIYRHVWLHVTGPVHVAPWGVFASTPRADTSSATVSVQTQVLNESTTPQAATIQTVLLGPDGSQVAVFPETKCDLPTTDAPEIKQEITVKNPALWSPEKRQISHIITRVLIGGNLVDEVTTDFGIRALKWSAENGLTLNGTTVKLSGGCIHHDNGVLGACAFDRAEERKVELLKAAGFNAIRTAHNPPSPGLLDACDRLGMLVMDEAFDCWAGGKNKCDYSVVFKDWWERDIDSMVKRDRNHPSVVLWSLGNEIPGIYSDMGGEYGPKLAERVHSLDKTRPVTNGILGWPVDEKKPKPDDAQKQKNADANWNSLDIVGSNYALNRHISQHKQFPDRVVVSTESSPPIGKAYEVADNPFAIGDFVWSGQDYLGESGVGRWFYVGDPSEPLDPPRPGDKPDQIRPVMHGNDKLFPWHGANSGDLDILGNSKPAAHLRNITWNMGEKLAMAVRQPQDDRKIITVGCGWYPTWESWTWPGEEGKPMEVEVYSRYESVRLYLNGKPVEEKPTARGQNFKASFTLNYEPGTLKAVGVQDGKAVEEVKFVTTGAPAAIRLTPDRAAIKADGQDLSFVKVEVVDKDGQLQPNADQEIEFSLTGPGAIAGLGNANLKDETPYQGKSCHVFHGRALVVIRGSKEADNLTLKAHAGGLTSATVKIETK
jgi:beta-galactosidase